MTSKVGRFNLNVDPETPWGAAQHRHAREAGVCPGADVWRRDRGTGPGRRRSWARTWLRHPSGRAPVPWASLHRLASRAEHAAWPLPGGSGLALGSENSGPRWKLSNCVFVKVTAQDVQGTVSQ